MPSSFTPSEALKDETCAAFAGARTKDGWVCAWAHRRRGWGADLVVQRPTSRQEVLVARADSVGWPVFSPDGAELLVVVDNVLKLCDCEKGETETLYAPPDGEKLKGAPRWYERPARKSKRRRRRGHSAATSRGAAAAATLTFRGDEHRAAGPTARCFL